VVLCPDGQTAIDKFDKNEYNICLLDVMMPHKNGFDVAKKIRQQSDMVPILFLTAKSLEEDRIKGFEVGADDYIIKPFSMQELLMRMDVFLRRSKKMHSEQSLNFNIGKLRFHYTDLKLSIDSQVFNLTQKEADLLKFLCQHPNRILKREEVLLNVWGKDDYFLGRSMDVFITKLRKYFKEDPQVNLETIHGVGFRFNVPPEDE
jgi:DNA-binding response OmpR family regulator